MEPSSSFPGSGSSFVILSVSIVGILSTALLLLAYYLFLTRCGLLFFWRPDLQLQLQDHHRISVSVTVHQEEPPRRSGLEEAAIRRIPTFRYRHGAKQQGECAVCLGDFRDGERLRLLPACRHAFHIDCIDAWLNATANCPLCRAAVADGPAPAAPALSYSCHHLHLPLPATSVAGNVIIDIADENAPAEQAAAPDDSNDRGSSSTLSMPMRARRSLSMDSSTDKRFYLALQRIIQHQHTQQEAAAATGKGECAAAATDSSSSRRLRRSFFSFSQSRGSRSAILPL